LCQSHLPAGTFGNVWMAGPKPELTAPVIGFLAANTRGKMFLLKAAALAAGLVFGSVGIASKAADNNGHSRVAFFGFRLINTSLESTTAAEDRRIHMAPRAMFCAVAGFDKKK
jgi:hypothetical protein